MNSQTVSTKLQWIAEQAGRDPKRVFTSLAHLIDADFLKEAYRRTRKDASPGVDGVTAKEYAENLDVNLENLHERLKSGRYKAPPVKRIWLKQGEKLRPIGMTGFEDKIVQRAVAMILKGCLRAGLRRLLPRVSGRPQPAPGTGRAMAEVRGEWRRLDRRL